jgi:hypothetical protein
MKSPRQEQAICSQYTVHPSYTFVKDVIITDSHNSASILLDAMAAPNREQRVSLRQH